MGGAVPALSTRPCLGAGNVCFGFQCPAYTAISCCFVTGLLQHSLIYDLCLLFAVILFPSALRNVLFLSTKSFRKHRGWKAQAIDSRHSSMLPGKRTRVQLLPLLATGFVLFHASFMFSKWNWEQCFFFCAKPLWRNNDEPPH